MRIGRLRALRGARVEIAACTTGAKTVRLRWNHEHLRNILWLSPKGQENRYVQGLGPRHLDWSPAARGVYVPLLFVGFCAGRDRRAPHAARKKDGENRASRLP